MCGAACCFWRTWYVPQDRSTTGQKVANIDEFHDQFRKAQESGEWGTGWYDEIHIVKERHHLNDKCPDDVDLIDVLEHICDGVMAGMARSGTYRNEPISDDVLRRAVANTAKKLCAEVHVINKEA